MISKQLLKLPFQTSNMGREIMSSLTACNLQAHNYNNKYPATAINVNKPAFISVAPNLLAALAT